MRNNRYMLLEASCSIRSTLKIAAPVTFGTYQEAAEEMCKRYLQVTAIDPVSEAGRTQMSRELEGYSATTERDGLYAEWKICRLEAGTWTIPEEPLIETFGTLYADGIPQANPVRPTFGGDIPQYKGGTITIGDTAEDPAYAIHWVRTNGMLVCDRNILINLNSEILADEGFMTGKQVVIDGEQYLCRLLHGESYLAYHDEWKLMMDDVGNGDAFWHWEGAYSICGRPDELRDRQPHHCVVRGGKTAGERNLIDAKSYFARYSQRPNEFNDCPVGFRPVLIPQE